MFDQFTTALPSSQSNGVFRFGVIPEEDNFVLAHTHVQFHRVHPSSQPIGGGGNSVLTGGLQEKS